MNRTLAALMMTVTALGAALSAAPALAQGAEGPINVVSPQPLPIDDSRPRVFLGGSIDMGGAPDWQAAMTSALADMDVVILNPRRPDWNPTGAPRPTSPSSAVRSSGNWRRWNPPTSSSCISPPARKARSVCWKWACTRAAAN